MSRWIVWTAAVSALVALGVVGAWFVRIEIARRVIADVLREEGVPVTGFRIADLEPDGARLTDVRVGDDGALEVRELTASYTLGGVASGRLEKVVVRGAALKVAIGAGGASFGSLDPLLEGGDGAADGGIPPLPPIRFEDARIIAETPLGVFTITANGDVASRPTGRLELSSDVAVATPGGPLSGQLETDLSPDGAFTGEFAIADGNLRWRRASTRAVGGHIRFAGGAGAAPAMAGRITGAVLDLAGGRFENAAASFDLEGERLHLAARLATGPGDAGLDVSLDADLADAPMAISVQGTARGTQSSNLWTAWGLPPVRDGKARFSIALAGAPAELAGDFRIRLGAAAAEIGRSVARDPALVLVGKVALRDRVLELRPAEGSRLRATSLRPSKDVALTAPLDLPVRPGDRPMVALDLRDPTRLPVEIDLRLGSSPYRASVALGDGRNVEIVGASPDLTVSGRGDASSGEVAATVEATGGTADLPAYRLRLRGVGGQAQYPLVSSGTDPIARFRVDRLSVDGKPAMIVPLSLDGTVARSANGVAVEAHLRDRGKRVAADIRARYDPDKDEGGAQITLRPLEFAPGVLQPGDVFPAAKPLIAEARGRVSGRADARWSGSELSAVLTLPLNHLSFKVKGVSVQDVNGTLRYTHGGASTPAQTLTIGRVGAGVALTEGGLRFRITRERKLLIEDMSWRLADGRVFARDVTIDPRADGADMVLQAEGIDLRRLLQEANVAAVSATGRLSGRIPIGLVAGKVSIRDGLLETSAPGVLRYRSKVSLEEIRTTRPETALMIEALQNFHYERVGMTINQDPGGEAVIALQIRGKNPDLMEGQPFIFNINLSGDLIQVVECFVEGYCSSEEIGQMLLQFLE